MSFVHLSLFTTDISSSYVSRLDPEHGHHHGHVHDLEASLPSHPTHSHNTCKCSPSSEPHERTPLITPQPTTVQRPQTLSAHETSQIFDGHHHFESRASHCTDDPVSPRVLPKPFDNAQDEHSDGITVHTHRTKPLSSPYDSAEDDSTTVAACSQDQSEQSEPESRETPASLPRRQIVGILVHTRFNRRSAARLLTVWVGSASRNHDPLVRHRSHVVDHVRIRV